MADITRKYHIDTLKRVRINSEDKQTIGYNSESGKSFIEVKNSAHYNEVIARRYAPNEITIIETLKNMIYRNGLEVLLLDANGNMNFEIDREKIFLLLGIAKDIECIDNKLLENMDLIATETSRICSEKLKISKEKRNAFQQLLRNFIFVELIQNRIIGNKITISKFDNYIDYKVNRVLKCLDIKVNLTKVLDFKLEYNSEVLNVNNKEFLNLKEKTNSKTIVHKIS